MIHTIGQWIEEHIRIPGLPAWASVLVLAFLMAITSIAITIFALVRIPADYFQGPHPPGITRWKHPVLRWTLRLFRNTLGWFLVLLGILLSFPGIPGQGLLTILLGLMLVEFPGKRRLEQRFVRWPRVRNAIDTLRTRFGREPLVLDEVTGPSDSKS